MSYLNDLTPFTYVSGEPLDLYAPGGPTHQPWDSVMQFARHIRKKRGDLVFYRADNSRRWLLVGIREYPFYVGAIGYEDGAYCVRCEHTIHNGKRGAWGPYASQRHSKHLTTATSHARRFLVRDSWGRHYNRRCSDARGAFSSRVGYVGTAYNGLMDVVTGATHTRAHLNSGYWDSIIDLTLGLADKAASPLSEYEQKVVDKMLQVRSSTQETMAQYKAEREAQYVVLSASPVERYDYLIQGPDDFALWTDSVPEPIARKAAVLMTAEDGTYLTKIGYRYNENCFVPLITDEEMSCLIQPK